MPHPSRELHDPEAAIRGVLLEQLIIDRCGGVSDSVPSDSCGNAVDKELRPTEISVGGDVKSLVT